MWLHEIKHDGFRIIARKDGAEVKLYSRRGKAFTRRFPLIIEALARLSRQRIGHGSCSTDALSKGAQRCAGAKGPARLIESTATPESARAFQMRVHRKNPAESTAEALSGGAWLGKA